MAFEQEELWEAANERIPWHEKLEGEEAIQNRVHEWVLHKFFIFYLSKLKNMMNKHEFRLILIHELIAYALC